MGGSSDAIATVPGVHPHISPETLGNQTQAFVHSAVHALTAENQPITILLNKDVEIMNFLMENTELWKGILRAILQYIENEIDAKELKEYVYSIFLSRGSSLGNDPQLSERIDKAILQNAPLRKYAKHHGKDAQSWIETPLEYMQRWNKKQLRKRLLDSLNIKPLIRNDGSEEIPIKPLKRRLTLIKNYLRTIEHIDIDTVVVQKESGDSQVGETWNKHFGTINEFDKLVDLFYLGLHENESRANWISRYIQAIYAWSDISEIIDEQRKAYQRLKQIIGKLQRNGWTFEEIKSSVEEAEGVMYRFQFVSERGNIIRGVLGVKSVTSTLLKLMADPLYLGVDALRDMIRGAIFFDEITDMNERSEIMTYITQELFEPAYYILKNKGILGEGQLENTEDMLKRVGSPPFYTSDAKKGHSATEWDANASTSGFTRTEVGLEQVGIEMQYHENEERWKRKNYTGYSSHSIFEAGRIITGYTRGQAYVTGRQLIAILIEKEASIKSGVPLEDIIKKWIGNNFIVVHEVQSGEKSGKIYFGTKKYENRLTQKFGRTQKITDPKRLNEIIQAVVDWGRDRYNPLEKSA